MGNLNTRTHNRKLRLKDEERERSERERLDKASEPYRVLQRACRSLKYSIVGDGVNDAAQERILDEYIDQLDELLDELELKYGELPKSSRSQISLERDRAVNAIAYSRIEGISPEHDADDGKDKFPFRSIG